MNKTFLKNILRDIRDTKGKVISIGVMVGLAASVVVGMLITGVTMRNTLSNSLKSYNHPDLIVRSTYGLDYEDELILKKDPDISKLSLLKTADLIDDETLIRVKSLNDDISKYVLTSGKDPSNKNEIIIDEILSKKYKIGDTLHFSYVENSRIDDEVMKNLDYRIVGFFKTSDFFMEDMRELSFTAKKELDGYAYVLEENFDTDKYGEANIIYSKKSDMTIDSDQYRKFVIEKKDSIENRLSNRPGQVLKEIKSEVNDELDGARDDINKARKDLSDAEKELKEARIDLDRGFKDYEDAKNEFETKISDGKDKLQKSQIELKQGQDSLDKAFKEYEDNLREFNNQIATAREEISANEKNLRDGQVEIDSGSEELNKGYQKLEEQFKSPREKLDAAKNQLDLSKSELDKTTSELEAGYNEISLARLKLDERVKELDQLELSLQESTSDQSSEETDIDISSNDYNQMKETLIQGRNEVESARNDLLIRESELDKSRDELESYKIEYETGLFEYQQNKKQLDDNYNLEKSKLDKSKSELNNKQNEIDKGYEKLNQAKNELENKSREGQLELDGALAQINQKQNEIDNGWKQYNQGMADLETQESVGREKLKESYQKLLDGEEEYQKGLDEFNKQKDDAEAKIAEGEDQIREGKDALVRLIDPEYKVESVYDNEGINTYYQNSLNMDELTKVFPTFFYLVAMLVTLTTMKRYIEEQRTINGTLKSLGYFNKDISGRFYIYGIIPTLVGSIIGSIVGRYVIANIIIKAYSSGFGNLGIDFVNSIPYISFAIALSVILIALTVYFSSKETVGQSPANLLKPKAPNIGKKVWLENIGPIWNKMSFMQKITARNIFRYKSRMFMTLFGVGGCTALTFFGFSMIDSIKDTINTEQNEINHYDLIALVDEKASDKDKKSYEDAIKKYESLDIRFEEGTIINDSKRRNVNIVIPSKNKNLYKYVNLRTPKRNPINLANESAVISEKAADQLGLSVGDRISFSYDNKYYELPITNIIENYTGDYLYIEKDSFEQITGKKAIMNANYLKGDADKMIKNIENQSAIVAIINASVIYASIDVLLSNLNLVIGVITLISVLLALVVLYNLININVSERKRELATIKVLGFYPREVTSYIFREIFILTILGIIVGYGLGYVMFRYIIYVVAPDNVLLSYRVNPGPFVFSGLITIAISLVLLIIVHKKLQEIDMAEAMGSGVE